MNNLIIIAHPDKNSFCYNGILKTIERTLIQHQEDLHRIDLYEENNSFYFGKEKIKQYKDLITWSNRIYFISPVWWFRTAPALPVMLIYLNSVKYRLVMGVYSFVFGWFKTKTRQFWSVPFISQQQRLEYLHSVETDLTKAIRHSNKWSRLS